jgi:hypothetical protein
MLSAANQTLADNPDDPDTGTWGALTTSFAVC